jgi:hypothetical protein
MGRHTDQYGMYYSREGVGSYDEFINFDERTKSKEFESDFARIERDATRKISVTEIG